ncbi:MAG: hypothetical protein HYX72_09505 [Acidobacteria bacterium]|nr:hypothetical protein [Acidobacteriota bacterium]
MHDNHFHVSFFFGGKLPMSFCQMSIFFVLQSSLVVGFAQHAEGGALQTERPSREKMAELVKGFLGDNATVFEEVQPMVGDFDGDGRRDGAVVLRMEHGFRAILAKGVKIAELEAPKLPTADAPHHCLGLLIVQGFETLRKEKYLFYGCFSNWRLIPKRQLVIPTGLAPGRGDALRLHMETGAFLVLYSDGKSYHAYYEHEHGR